MGATTNMDAAAAATTEWALRALLDAAPAIEWFHSHPQKGQWREQWEEEGFLVMEDVLDGPQLAAYTTM